MSKKVNIAKTATLLVVAVLLTILVCFSPVYAWFYSTSNANAEISGEILSFYFTANGTFNGDIEFSPGNGNSPSGNNFVYSKTPAGMYPGQKMTAKLVLSNAESNVDAIYKISVKDIATNNFPKDCLITIKDSNGNGFGPYTFNNSTPLYPTASCTDLYAADSSYAYIEAEAEKELTIVIEWPYDYDDIPNGAAPEEYTDAASKNQGDNEFLSNSNGNDFTVVLEIVAEQVA